MMVALAVGIVTGIATVVNKGANTDVITVFAVVIGMHGAIGVGNGGDIVFCYSCCCWGY